MIISRGAGGKAGVASAGLLFAVLVAACGSSGSGGGSGGSGGGGGAFTPATPPSDVCSLLTLSDVQALMPEAKPGAEQQVPDTSNLGFWSRDCKWDGTARNVELVVFGATTKEGLAGIKLAAQSGTKNTPVSGLGDEAHYWEQDTTDNGLWALQGSKSVDVTAYFFTPFPTAAQLQPLVAKVLGEIK